MASISWALVIVLFMNMLMLSVPVQSYGMTVVLGSVYCDQCLEGLCTFWGLPLSGATVRVECLDNNGKVRLQQQGVTNLLGFYAIEFDGFPNMDSCRARLVSTSPNTSCNIAGDMAMPIVLSLDLFGIVTYLAAGLSYKPSTPSPICPSTFKNLQSGLPPLQFSELSACNHQYWLNPRYKCYWRVWSPNTKVSVWYGAAAASKFGADLTLKQGLQLGNSSDPHQLLLREAITATLNAFNSFKFYYNAVQVDYYFNNALAGTQEDVVNWAVNFRTANSGFSGKAKCLLTPCTS